MNDHAKVNGPQTERSPVPSEQGSTTIPASGPRQRSAADDTIRPERFSLPPDDAYKAHDTIPSPPPDISEE